MLSVDNRLQEYAHAMLKQAVEENEADSGTATLIDVKTGEILALANAPSFDPMIENTLTALMPKTEW